MAEPISSSHPSSPVHTCVNCAICLDDMYDVSPADNTINANQRFGVTRNGHHVRLSCGHTFHKDCAVGKGETKGFLQVKTECPTCRHKVEPYVLRNINRKLKTQFRPISAVENMNNALREDLEYGHRDINSAENQRLWEAELHQRATHPDQPRVPDYHPRNINDLFAILSGFSPLQSRAQNRLNEAMARPQTQRSQQRRYQRFDLPSSTPRISPYQNRQRTSHMTGATQSLFRYNLTMPTFQPQPRLNTSLFEAFNFLNALQLSPPRRQPFFGCDFGFGFGFGFHQPVGSVWLGDDRLLRPRLIGVLL